MLNALVEKIRAVVVSQQRNLKNLSSLVFVNFAVAGVGFITQLQIANILGKESYGLIAYGMAMATYGAVVIRFGLDRTLVRDLIHYPDKFTATVKASLILRFSLFFIVIASIIAWKLTLPPDSDITWGVVLIVVANTAMSIDLQAVFDSWHEMTKHAFYNLIQRVLYFCVIWSIILVDPKMLSILHVGVAAFMAVMIYLILQYSWAIKKLPIDTCNDNLLTTSFRMAKNNVVVWFAALGGLSFGTINQLVLKQSHGSSELGGYAAAWMMVTLVTMLLTQIARVGNPSTAHMTAGGATKGQKIKFLVKYTSFMVLMSLPVALPSIFFPELILQTLFKPEYTTASPLLRIMGFYMPIFAVGLVTAQYLISSKREKNYLKSVLFGGAVGIILCLIIIPKYGAIGASWVLLISHGISITLYVYYVVREVITPI